MRALALAALLLVSGCASAAARPAARSGPGRAVDPIPSAVLSAPPEAASLWPRDSAAQRRSSLIADPIARGRGDIVTVLVHEAQTVTNKETTDLKQDSHLLAQLNQLGALPAAFRNGLPAGEVTSSREFSANGQYDKAGDFETRITATIVDVQPNGNLIIEGTRAVRMDDEVKTLKISGIVRPLDLTTSNTVLSENVAEASVSYEGDGPLTRNQKRGFLGTVFDYLFHNLWPF
jgi:flagellar L-ring protein precursor FlgH